MKRVVLRNMQQPLISIIVPVYNTEKYVENCILSVLGQSFGDYELILVNDGSTDKSLDQCLFWIKDERVHVISTENQGVSHARNVGLSNASGKWIMFLDSDDYLLEDSLKKLIPYTQMNVQEICALYMDKREDFGDVRYKVANSEDVMTMSLDPINNNLLPEFYQFKDSTLLSCCGKLFLNEIIKKNQLYFEEDLHLSEDLIFHLEYLSCIKNVLLTNVAVFFYRCNPTSATRSFYGGYFNDRICLIKKLQSYRHAAISVHIISTLLFFICKVEKYAGNDEKRKIESEISVFFSEHQSMLRDVKEKDLSNGRWQRIIYKMAIKLFLGKMDKMAFRLLKLYTLVARGEI